MNQKKLCGNCNSSDFSAINQLATGQLFGVPYEYVRIYDRCTQCGTEHQDSLERKYSEENREIGEKQAINTLMETEQGVFKKRQRVVSAACRNRAGQIICSPRHWDATMHSVAQSSSNPASWYDDDWDEQGFVDQWGTFLTREEARVIAIFNNQIVRRCGGDSHRLYSENLY